ncbi:MAG: hypothetical protein GX652_02190 [Burkholderiaceae bacterium]|nr:hypothetical protein [Burkholderiaceae bacterium]
MPRPSDVAARPGGPWRQPVVWLALVVFLASIAGCIVTIVLAVQAADPSDDVTHERFFRVPVSRAQQ